MEQALLQIDDLRLLDAIGRTGSLAAAARGIGVNHASAWRRLGALEVRLGVRLFERGRAGYAATPAGDEAISTAARTLQELDALSRRLSGQDVKPSGVVRLTTTDTLIDILAPALVALRASHPEILVEVVTSNAFFTLTRRDADIALRPAAQAPEGLVARRLASVATAVYAAPAYLAGRGDHDPLSLDWLAPEEGLAHLGSARWIARHVPTARVVHRASSLSALRAAARAGLGVTPLPCYFAEQDEGLTQVLPPKPEMGTNLWLITHPDLRRAAKIRVVLEAVAAHVARFRQQFQAD